MSNIPYYFDTPVPSDFRKNGWFKSDNCLKFVTWAFSRCSSKEHVVCHDGKNIKLKPFQFIFGRYKCSLETNMSEDEVRTQVKSMERAGFLKKSPNETPSRFTLFEWTTTAFSQNNPQVNPQVTPKSSPSHPHNLDDINTEKEIDQDQIDLGNPDDDSEVLEFNLKKGGKIKSTVNKVTEILKKDDWVENQINQAIEKMKKFNPSMNGKIEAYLTSILINQKKESKTCKQSQEKKKKEELPKDKGYYMGNDLSEAPLAKSARLNGLK